MNNMRVAGIHHCSPMQFHITWSRRPLAFLGRNILLQTGAFILPLTCYDWRRIISRSIDSYMYSDLSKVCHVCGQRKLETSFGRWNPRSWIHERPFCVPSLPRKQTPPWSFALILTSRQPYDQWHKLIVVLLLESQQFALIKSHQRISNGILGWFGCTWQHLTVADYVYDTPAISAISNTLAGWAANC